MPEFKRQLGNEQWELFKSTAYDADGSWLRDALADERLFFALRNNRIDVYFSGALIFQISFGKAELSVQTHIKYLMRDKHEQSYVKLKGGRFQYEPSKSLQDVYTPGSSLLQMMAASSYYSGVENAGVYKAIIGDPLVLDVEISFSSPDSDPDDSRPQPVEKRVRRKQDRVDVVRLEQKSDEARLIFWEAKHYGNSQLFNDEILKQIERYETAIGVSRDDLVRAYREVCYFQARIARLRREFGLSNVGDEHLDWLASIASGETPLVIEERPSLFVFGFDQAQKTRWQKREKELLEVLGQGRLRAIGTPENGSLGKGIK